MENEFIILKQDTLSPAQDFALLRKAGLEYIENLGSDLWTDYNAHDPGITMLEALCYAITELGYKANLDIKDLLADVNDKITAGQPFFTARQILTCNPLTINDYRKLLADIIGVHNAWLYVVDRITSASGVSKPVNEVPLFADCKKDQLSVKKTEHPLYLNGLYQVLLDLDNDEQFGDLNKGDIELWNPISSGAMPKFTAGEISFTMELPYVQEINKDWVVAAADETKVTGVVVKQVNGKWKCTVSTNTVLPDVTFTVTVNSKPAQNVIELPDMQNFFSVKYVNQVFYQYLQKINKIESILLQAKKTLHGNRNLCEDFITIKTVKAEEVAICVDIDVRADTDMEAVQAEVFYAIENYLNPSINFYLLKELMAKGTPVDKIFEGPKLNHGFIDTTELEATQLREVIHTSDIINLLMDIKGVLSVRNFLMTKYDQDGNVVPGQSGLQWCMHISPGNKPVLSLNRSKIIFFKNNFPFLSSYGEVRDSLQLMRAARERPKLKGQQDDLPVPRGNYKNIEDYWPVQNDFPQTYGIGHAGLPLTATPLRKAQAKQMKAYLLFYDQLLADFFSQIKNAKQLFGLEDIKQTYFAQYLGKVPDILPVYKQDPPGNAILNNVYANQDSTLASANKQWKALVEPHTLYHDRRNRFLNHLLARFSESFNEYVLMMYSINFTDSTAKSIGEDKLINSKIDFLKEYPVLSYERGKAFNFFSITESGAIDDAMLWDTANVSGLEKRTSKLAGIKNYYRRFLSCIKNIEINTIREIEIQPDSTELVKIYFSFTLTNKAGQVLVPNQKFSSRADLQKVVDKLVDLLNDKANYLFDAASKKIEVISTESTVLAVSQVAYADKPEADKAIKHFEQEFANDCADAEGMLLIEHLLLRPRTSQYQLMQVCLNNDCEFCGEEDPYSYRISVFLPYWSGQFNNLNFREYFEQLIRTEAPAHVMLKVCWLNNQQMRMLELAYKRWVAALARFTLNAVDPFIYNEFKAANDALVTLLPTLHSNYPEATLHNCDESININPVRLGKTILGTIKPKNNE